VNTQATPYDLVGGASGVRKLVARFYDLMGELPEAQHVLAMHPAELHDSREKLFDFLSGCSVLRWATVIDAAWGGPLPG
jgi:hemoglobin